MDLESLDLVMVFTSLPSSESGSGSAAESDKQLKFTMRTYRSDFSAGEPGSVGPKVSLVEHGPHIDWVLRRSRIAAPNLAKIARKQAKLRPVTSARKNVEHDKFQGKIGRVHIKRQSMDGLVHQSRFRKAFKRGREPSGKGAAGSDASAGKSKKARRG